MIASSNTPNAVLAPNGGCRCENLSADRVTRALEEYAASVDAGQPIARDVLLDKYSDVAEELAAGETPPIDGTPMPAVPAPPVVQKENKPSRRDRKKQKAG